MSEQKNIINCNLIPMVLLVGNFITTMTYKTDVGCTHNWVNWSEIVRNYLGSIKHVLLHCLFYKVVYNRVADNKSSSFQKRNCFYEVFRAFKEHKKYVNFRPIMRIKFHWNEQNMFVCGEHMVKICYWWEKNAVSMARCQ